jgi:hypothetical protein
MEKGICWKSKTGDGVLVVVVSDHDVKEPGDCSDIDSQAEEVDPRRLSSTSETGEQGTVGFDMILPVLGFRFDLSGVLIWSTKTKEEG